VYEVKTSEDHDPPLPQRTYDRTPYCSHVQYCTRTGNWKVLLEKLLPIIL
jgi:hypothetical protein